MRILFLHINFPAQFRHLATAIGSSPKNQVVYGTVTGRANFKGVRRVHYKPHREPRKEVHPYVRPYEKAVLHGQAAYRMCRALKQRGFVPDIVYGHSGFGPTMYVRDAFPDARIMCYFEWYFHSRGQGAGFRPDQSFTEDDVLLIRGRNAPILLDLAMCDWGLTPTTWQYQQFPERFQDRLTVLHDGVPVDYFVPKPGAKLILPELDLSHADEIVTYVARGMEPTRGFPEMIKLARELQQRRPKVHVVIVGEDRVAYGAKLPEGDSWKKRMLAEVEVDETRLHFTGPLPYGQYLKVLQASSAHVYLTVPFVLSWSMIEAMCAGCVVIGSDTPPVREVIEDGKNGLLVGFFDIEGIADRVEEVLDHPTRMAEIREHARQTVLERYALKDLLPKHLAVLEDVANGRRPKAGPQDV
ncbi:MAG: glycosyltransferase [Alphaproteobacteria bacterium]|nr:glycosyltransferase [Alphaproteobacteria bacterium]